MSASNLNETLSQLVAEACAHAPRSVERQQRIQQIYQLVVHSGKLWRENTPYYGDAFQEAWEYCCQHLDDYDPSRSAVITWIDNHLKWKLKEWRRRERRDSERNASSIQTQEGKTLSPIENLASDSGTELAEQIWHNTL